MSKISVSFIYLFIIYYISSFTSAEVAEWSNAPALRAGVLGLHGFKSHPLRFSIFLFFFLKTQTYINYFLLYIIVLKNKNKDIYECRTL